MLLAFNQKARPFSRLAKPPLPLRVALPGRIPYGSSLPAWLALFVFSAQPVFADHFADEINVLRSQAIEAQVQGRGNIALGYYEKALKTAGSAYGAGSPFLAEIYYDMGSLCLSMSDFNRAEDYLNQSVKLNPNSTSAHLKLSELLRLRGRNDEAAKQAVAVLAKHRDDMVAHQELALAYEGNEDGVRAYREYSAVEQLIQMEKSRVEGGAMPVKFSMPLFAKPKPAEDTSQQSAAADKQSERDKAALDAGKKAEQDAKKASAESKKKAEQDARKASAETKKKAEQDARKALAESKKKAEAEKKKKAEGKTGKPDKAKPEGAKPADSAAEPTMSGLPASLRGKAVLLTPVGKKKPATAESSSTVPVETKKPPAAAKPAPEPAKKAPAPAKPPPEESSNEAELEATKASPLKPAKQEEAKAEPRKAVVPKAGKHAAGLVPPPPPVVPTFPVMVAPPPPPPPKPKPVAAPKKVEEKPKEPASGKESEKNEDDDFLLDWGGAKGKKK